MLNKSINSNYIPVDKEPDLVRDHRTRAILNINVGAKESYNKQRAERLSIKNAISEIDDLKSEISDIKSLLQKVLDKIG